MEKITFVCVTQNRVGNLKRNFPRILPYVDKAVIIDGGSVDGTEEYCKSFDNVEWYHRKWDDSFANQYNEYLKHVNEGWVLIFDDDEFPSEELMRELPQIVESSQKGDKFSCVEFRSWSINPEDNPPKDHPDDYWRKMFFRYQSGMHYSVDLHQCLVGYQNGKHARSNLTYQHIKTPRDVARNACRNYFIAGIWLPNASDGLRGEEWKKLHDIIKKHYPLVTTFSDLNTIFVGGGVKAELQDWLIEHKDFGSNLYHEVHHFFEYYFEILNPHEYTEEVKVRVASLAAEKTYFDIVLDTDTWNPPGDSRKLGLALKTVTYRQGKKWSTMTVLNPNLELKNFHGVEGGNTGNNFSWSSDGALIRLYGVDNPPDEVVLEFVWPPRPGQSSTVRVGERVQKISRNAVMV